MSISVVDYRYAESFAQVLKDDELFNIEQDLLSINKIISENLDIASFWSSPYISGVDKSNIISSQLKNKLHPKVLHFILTLIRLRRLDHFSSICNHFQKIVDFRLNRVKVEVILPINIGKNQANEKLQSEIFDFCNMYKAEIGLPDIKKENLFFSFEYSSTIIAGFKIQLNGCCLDTSVSSYLQDWKRRVDKNQLVVSSVFI